MTDDRTLLLRGVVLAVLVAAMVAGPVHHQVLGRPYHPLFKPWRMYFGHGTDLCEVTYTQVAATGATRTLDRYDLLGYAPWTEAPTDVRNLPDGPAIGRVGQQLCRALPARRPDVRATARCATVRGWRPAFDGSVNLCALGAQEVEDLRPAKDKRR